MGHEKDTEISPPRMRSTMNRPSVDKLSGLITKNMNPNPPIQKNQPLTVQNSNSNPVLTNQKKYVFDKNNMLNGQLYSQVNISAMSIPLSNSSTSRKKQESKFKSNQILPGGEILHNKNSTSAHQNLPLKGHSKNSHITNNLPSIVAGRANHATILDSQDSSGRRYRKGNGKQGSLYLMQNQ